MISVAVEDPGMSSFLVSVSVSGYDFTFLCLFGLFVMSTTPHDQFFFVPLFVHNISLTPVMSCPP